MRNYPSKFAGYPLNLAPFRKLADEYGLWLLEDSCHAPGGFYHDDSNTKQSCGNGQYADLAIFSFHPVKHIASGEGGWLQPTTRTFIIFFFNFERTVLQSKKKTSRKMKEDGIMKCNLWIQLPSPRYFMCFRKLPT